jgi:hypothetical protein
MAFIVYDERIARTRAYEEGWMEGARAAMLRLLPRILKAKFGKEGADLMSLINDQSPLARLEELTLQAGVATKVESLSPHFSKS